jgi:hypothetical protein
LTIRDRAPAGLAAAVPSLDAVAADPTLAAGLAPAARQVLMLKAAAVIAACAAPPQGRESPPDSHGSLAILTTRHLAEIWKMPEAKIRDLCRAGTLPARKLGSKEWVIAADALRDWLPKAPLAKQVSPGLSSSYDPGRGSQAPQAAQPYTVEIRRPARRPQDHSRQVGGRDEGDERHDGAATAHHRAAGTAGARTATPSASGDDSPSKGALT